MPDAAGAVEGAGQQGARPGGAKLHEGHHVGVPHQHCPRLPELARLQPQQTSWVRASVAACGLFWYVVVLDSALPDELHDMQ